MAIRNGDGYVFSTTNNQSTLGIQKEFADMYDGAVPPEVCSPFKVRNVKEVTEGESTIVTYDICPGTVNNLMPQVYNDVEEKFEYLDDLTEGYKLVLDFASTSSCFIYLRAGPDPSTNAFPATAPIDPYDPDDPYPTVFNTGSALPADSDTYGYLAIAKVNALGDGVYSVDQYVTGSLWGDRIKVGDQTARYYYARI
jgi:hypothetical protein